jgi:hypothetical protein
MTIHTLTTETLVELSERAWIEGYDRACNVAEKGVNPASMKNTASYHHFRCQDVERLMSWLEGKR